MAIQRELYLDKLKARMNNGMIKIVTGMRRSGKSFLLFNLFYNYLLDSGVKEDNIIALNLEDEDNAEYRNPHKLYEYLKSKLGQGGQYYVLLDEVQYAISSSDIASDEPLPLYGILNGLLHKMNVDVYVTGSNSRFLSSDIRTEFRGRGDEVHVQPLSFAEFMSVYEGDKYDGLRDYMTYGGLPQITYFKTHEQKASYLTNLFEETYIKDIIARYNVRRNVNEFGELVDILASGVGSLTNPTKLSNTFKSSGNGQTEKARARRRNARTRPFCDRLSQIAVFVQARQARRYSRRGQRGDRRGAHRDKVRTLLRQDTALHGQGRYDRKPRRGGNGGDRRR